jgi:hypothetical protein
MHIMKYSRTVLLLALALTGVAQGGLLTSDSAAYNDGTTTWRGTQGFDALGFLVANVDYAVYAPGQFHASTALGNPVDPSNGSQYVYAYQIWNAPSAIASLSLFSVGFADVGESDAGTEGADKMPANINFLPFPTGVSPSNWTFNGVPAQSAVWNFIQPPVAVGDHSSVLIYTSPFAPETDSATLQGGALTASARLPSPVPEPGTCLLVLASAGVLLTIRTCRRRR